MAKTSRKTTRKQARASSQAAEDAETKPVSDWEWLIAAIGALMLAGLVGYLIHQALGNSRSPPQIEVRQTFLQQTEDGYLLGFRAVNKGKTTASSVLVRGRLKDADGKVIEQSEVAIDYLPGEGEQQGGLFFTRDPSRYGRDLRALGYAVP
jgi:uncharacterized protein (TIGR02588 family)